jgi:hypothetical protein
MVTSTNGRETRVVERGDSSLGLKPVPSAPPDQSGGSEIDRIGN